MNPKPKYSVWQNLRFMLALAWHKGKDVLALCVLFAALSLGINLAQLFIAPAVLAQVEAHAPLPRLLGSIAGFALALVLLNGLLGYVDQNTMFGRVRLRISLIGDLNEKACTTSYPNTRDPEALKLFEKAQDANRSNAQPAEHVWTTLTNILLNLAGFAVYLTLLSGLIGVVAVTTAAGFFISRQINEWGYRHREEEAAYQKKIDYIAQKTESIQLAKDIRIFGLRPWLSDVYEGTMRLYEAFINRRERIYTGACVVDAFLSLARNGIAYAYLIRLTLAEGLPASQFLLYFSAFTGFSTWVTGILQECSTLHKESLDLSTIQEYLHLPEPFRFADGAPIPPADRYELRLDHVTFRYPGTEKPVLQNLSLTLRPGEKIAVVGLNGAGKTTLVKLLCGFYDPDEGRVLLNGQDIRQFDRRAYYKLFSTVAQEISELDITVAQTVAQAVDGIDMDRVKACVEKAGLAEAIASLPQGYDTHLGKQVYLDGVELSGGQTQRLMLARALYKDGAFLVLDEPTAALDPIAESDIYQKYNEMTAGKSSVFISHRLASTRFCDRILFIKDGGIAEEGTHEELLHKGGAYAKLFEVQARYYQEGRDLDDIQIG